MDQKHLKRRHQTWYARVVVPPSLVSSIGKTEIVRSLHTRDLREANRLKHRVVADIMEVLSRAATTATLPKESADYVLAIAKEARARVKAGEQTLAEAEVEVEHTLDSHLDLLARKNDADVETGHPLLPEAHERSLKLAMRVLGDGNLTLLSEALEGYLKETKKRITRQTYAEKERELGEFLKWVGTNADAVTVTRKVAGRYVGEHLLPKGLSPKTVKDTLSHLSSFWSWMEGRGMVEANPWLRMSGTVKESTRGKQAKRRPWTDAELLKLLQGIPEGDPLLPMVAIAAYTGMRREEVASLRVQDLEDDALVIREGKTAAAVRRVPLHPALRPLVARLKEKSPDGYLIPGLLTGGADEKRSHMVGKRFGTIKERIGFKDAALNFHTLRNAFAQRCENAEVPESTTKLIVGHKRESITYGTYSPGPMFDVLRKAVEKVTYGDADAFVKKLAKTVEVTKQSQRWPRAKYNRSHQRRAA